VRLDFHESAEDDLAEIWNYYNATRNEASANRVVEKIRATCDLFVRHPHIGRERFDVVPDVRSYSCGDYVIYYFANEQAAAITVVRILHGARDIIGIEIEEP
jgi:plasmid stabilization system protein ParE